MEPIAVPFENLVIKGDILPGGTQPDVLCLHGAGTSERSRYAFLRDVLWNNGISSCAFDFIGHGETGGDMSQSSLESRTLQAKKVIETVEVQKPLRIIAGSMAGYNAIKLMEFYPVGCLVLFAPAVYRNDSYSVHFGPAFSELIRKEGSWNDTDAWDILGRYRGKLLIVCGDGDEVVPVALTQKIYDSASNASLRELMIIPGVTHAIMNHLKEHPEEFSRVSEKILTFLQ